jgi:hypothetical protein
LYLLKKAGRSWLSLSKPTAFDKLRPHFPGILRKYPFFLFLTLFFIIPTLACGAVGVYDPEATQVAMQGTVTALQATISALEQNIAQSQQDATPQVIVVTATPISTFTPSPQPLSENATVVAASSLEQTIQLTSTPTPTPLIIQPQDIVITVVATFTPTPTPAGYDEAPIIIEPPEGTIVEEGKEILLHWGWNGLLGSNERYDIKIRPDGQTRSAYVAWEDGVSHNFLANIAPGRYYWTVQVIKGIYKDSIVEPENRQLEAFLSPESKPRLIIIAAKSEEREKTPTPTPTPTP